MLLPASYLQHVSTEQPVKLPALMALPAQKFQALLQSFPKTTQSGLSQQYPTILACHLGLLFSSGYPGTVAHQAGVLGRKLSSVCVCVCVCVCVLDRISASVSTGEKQPSPEVVFTETALFIWEEQELCKGFLG